MSSKASSPETIFPNTFPMVKLPQYPHLRPDEALIWETYLTVIADPAISVAYDVHVGQIPTTFAQLSEPMRRHALAVYPKKLDVVMLLPTLSAIVELKPYAGLTAIGQVLSYCFLFSRQYPQFPSSKAFILTDRPQLDMHDLCDHFNITLWEYADLGPAPAQLSILP